MEVRVRIPPRTLGVVMLVCIALLWPMRWLGASLPSPLVLLCWALLTACAIVLTMDRR